MGGWGSCHSLSEWGKGLRGLQKPTSGLGAIIFWDAAAPSEHFERPHVECNGRQSLGPIFPQGPPPPLPHVHCRLHRRLPSVVRQPPRRYTWSPRNSEARLPETDTPRVRRDVHSAPECTRFGRESIWNRLRGRTYADVVLKLGVRLGSPDHLGLKWPGCPSGRRVPPHARGAAVLWGTPPLSPDAVKCRSGGKTDAASTFVAPEKPPFGWPLI